MSEIKVQKERFQEPIGNVLVVLSQLSQKMQGVFGEVLLNLQKSEDFAKKKIEHTLKSWTSSQQWAAKSHLIKAATGCMQVAIPFFAQQNPGLAEFNLFQIPNLQNVGNYIAALRHIADVKAKNLQDGLTLLGSGVGDTISSSLNATTTPKQEGYQTARGAKDKISQSTQLANQMQKESSETQSRILHTAATAYTNPNQ